MQFCAEEQPPAVSQSGKQRNNKYSKKAPKSSQKTPGSSQRTPRSSQRTPRSPQQTPRSASAPCPEAREAKKQTPKPVKPSQPQQREPPASALQAAGEKQAKENAPSAPAHQAAEDGQASGLTTTGEEDKASFKSPVKGGAGNPQPGSVQASPAAALTVAEGIAKFGQREFNFTYPRKIKRPQFNKPKQIEQPLVTHNMFSPFEDPEGMDQ